MAVFKNMFITNQGMLLFAKAQAGQSIHFTKLQVGSGRLSNQNPIEFNKLIDSKLDIPITSITTNTEQKSALIVGNITNQEVKTAEYICELGLWAMDPLEGEILYGYANCDEFGDYYAPKSQGSYSWQYQINVAVGNAANISAELSKLSWDYGLVSSNEFKYLTGVNQKEINNAIDCSLKSMNEQITEMTVLNRSLASEVAILKDASLNNFSNNIFLENFNDLNAINLVSGVYDTFNKRLVV